MDNSQTKIKPRQPTALAVNAPTETDVDQSKTYEKSQETEQKTPRRSPRRSTRNSSEVKKVPREVVVGKKKRSTRKRKSTEKVEHFRQQEAERAKKIKEAKERRKTKKKEKTNERKKPKVVNPKVTKARQMQSDDDSCTSSIDEKDVICCICNCGVDFSEKEAFNNERDFPPEKYEQTSADDNGVMICPSSNGEETKEQSATLGNKTSNSEDAIETKCAEVHNKDGDDHDGLDDDDQSCALMHKTSKTQDIMEAKCTGARTQTCNKDGGDHDGNDDDDQSSIPYCGVQLPAQLYDPNNALIICDGCDRSFHQRCHFVPVFCLPRGSWHCLICQFKEKILKDKPTSKKNGRAKQMEVKLKSKGNVDLETILALSNPLTVREVDSLFPSHKQRDKTFIGKVSDIHLKDGSIVTMQDRFEYQSSLLKAQILKTEVKRRIKSTIDGALSTIRLEEHTIRGFTETERAKKSLLENFQRSKRLPQQLVQSVFRMGTSKMKIRDLMYCIDSVICNKNDRQLLVDWFSKAKSGKIKISLEGDIDWNVLESKLFMGDSLRKEPRFDIADYDGDIEDDEDDDVDPTKKIRCCVCFNGQVDEDNDVIMCDGKNCFRAFHMKCCNPIVTQQMLDDDENGTWFCPYCCALANAVHYAETEYYGDELDNYESHDRERVESWDEAGDVFPEASLEVKSSELWKQGKRDKESDEYLNNLMGMQLTHNENEDIETDDESDHNFTLEDKDDGSISSSSSDDSDENDGVDMQWKIEQNEIDALSLCSSSQSLDDEDEPIDSNVKTRRSRKNPEEEHPINIGKVDASNILYSKRNRTKVDYRRLNGSIFGAIDRAGNAHDLDDDDEYEHIINKRQRSRSESSSTSQGTDDADESNVDESNNSNIKTRQRRKTPKTE